MNLEYFIAKRVTANGQQSFARLIIRIAVVAIALSMTVMIVATSLIRGFKNEISSKMFGFWGHIHIKHTNINRSYESVAIDINQDFYPHLDTLEQVRYLDKMQVGGVTVSDELVERETYGGIDHIQVFAYKAGIIKTKNEFEGIILKGVSTDFDWEYVKDYLMEGRPIALSDSLPSRDIIISQQTANRLKLGVEDKFTIHFVQDGEQLKRRLKVCGIYKTGIEEYDKRFALVDIRQIQGILGWSEQEVGGFEVFIDDIRDLEALTEHIYIEEIPSDLFALNSKDQFDSIFQWLGLQDINEKVIIILMIIVAIINMVTALMILILERTNMIGILKALGNTNFNIRKIFIYYAGYIILTGLFWGNLIGLGLCFLQKHFQFVKLSEADYYLSVAPIEFNVWAIVALNLGTLLLTLLFLTIPTYLVTTITPVKAIRFK